MWDAHGRRRRRRGEGSNHRQHLRFQLVIEEFVEKAPPSHINHFILLIRVNASGSLVQEIT